ncbi:hypothetical protein N658DRAFT_10442 [Parathielavia hyrcaniae]|uniref:Uncharacterized protein n=1 Tax=Parathielavia hyrcaniae TaxID=113614 RepID=A0AAN6Q9R4_9PEZI|nr:hypothetical protein N658DRAFT_10442 [Parathielavia hyrcaniae]
MVEGVQRLGQRARQRPPHGQGDFDHPAYVSGMDGAADFDPQVQEGSLSEGRAIGPPTSPQQMQATKSTSPTLLAAAGLMPITLPPQATAASVLVRGNKTIARRYTSSLTSLHGNQGAAKPRRPGSRQSLTGRRSTRPIKDGCRVSLRNQLLLVFFTLSPEDCGKELAQKRNHSSVVALTHKLPCPTRDRHRIQ